MKETGQEQFDKMMEGGAADCPEWVRGVFVKLWEVEKEYGDTEKDFPSWAESVLAAAATAFFPVMERKGKSWAEYLGLCVGSWKALDGDENWKNLLKGFLEKWSAFEKKAKRRFGKKRWAREMKRLEKRGKLIGGRLEDLFARCEKVCVARERIWDDAVALANGATAKERADFFRGYSRALDVSVLDERGFPLAQTTAFPLYTTIYFLAMCGVKFYSVTHLHFTLTKCLGAQVVGDVERVRRLCQRHKIKFSRRGRPRKK